MNVEQYASPLGPPRVGPPALLGLRSRFLARATVTARQDPRIHTLALWGPLAQGDADQWSGIDFIVGVSDESIPQVLEELSRQENLYGRSLITLSMPQKGVEGGGFLSVTYQQSGLLLHVDWYVCPASLGVAVGDTKPLIAHDGWPQTGRTFAQLLRAHPSHESETPRRWNRVLSTIPMQVAEVARGRPEVVHEAGKPMPDRTQAYAALSRRIGSLPASYRETLPPLFGYLAAARLLNH